MMDIEFDDPNVQQVFLGLKEEVRDHVGLTKDEEIVKRAKTAIANARKARNAKKIAVIGGNGQIGNYLLPLLVSEGHEVISVCRGNRGYFRSLAEFARVREVHLARGEEGFEQAVADLGRPDCHGGPFPANRPPDLLA